MATTTTAPRTDWRQEWFEIEDATYLNLAGQSPMPKVSIRAVQAALEAKKYPHQKPDSTFFEVPNRIRDSIAKLIGGKSEEIALTSGASAGAMAVAYGLAWKPGDEIVTAKGEFPLQYTAWKPMEEREGLKLRIVAPRERFISADDLIAAMTPKTRLVSVSMVRLASRPLAANKGRFCCSMSANAAAPCRWTSISWARTFWCARATNGCWVRLARDFFG
jgi:selenocysteine lyase/cysteine desulfurase